MNPKNPKIFVSILSAFAALVAFFISYLIIYLILGLIVEFVIDIPLIGFLFQKLLFVRGDSAASFVGTFSSLIAAVITIIFIYIINKHEPTCKLTCSISGITMMVVQGVSLIINLLSGAGIWINIMQIVAGYIIYTCSK